MNDAQNVCLKLLGIGGMVQKFGNIRQHDYK